MRTKSEKARKPGFFVKGHCSLLLNALVFLNEGIGTVIVNALKVLASAATLNLAWQG